MVSALLIAALFAADAPDAAKPDSMAEAGLAFTYSATLKVDDAEAALGVFIAAAESAGGYFMRKSKDYLELRVPSDKAPAIWKSLPERGLVVDQTLSSENLGTQLVNLNARIAAKRKVLDQYFALLQTAGDSTFFQIENALSNLQREIDAALGQKRVAEDRVDFARLHIAFSFHDRTAPLPTGNTRFPWLNALSLQNLLDRFGHGQTSHE
jgi:hypothetical protein